MIKVEIIRGDELNREVWEFEVHIDYVKPLIWFNSYFVEYKETTRKRLWRRSGFWTRLMRRDNTIQDPPLPPDVEDEMRDNFIEQVRHLITVR